MEERAPNVVFCTAMAITTSTLSDEIRLEANVRKKMYTRGMSVLDDHDEEQPEPKRTRPLNSLLVENARPPNMRSNSNHCAPIDRNVCGLQQNEVKHLSLGTGNKCEPLDEITCAQQVKPSDSIVGCEVEEAETTDEQVLAEEKPFVCSNSKTCSSNDSKPCSIPSGSTRIPFPFTITPRNADQAVHCTTNERARGSACTATNLDTTRLKSLVLEEAHDEVVMLNGRAKMSDIKTIYEKSTEVNRLSKRSFVDNVAKSMHHSLEERRLVDHERRTKRMRGATSATRVEGGTMVKCPICQLAIPGDMHDADFNTQINLHVDSCIGRVA
ncbi:hypothetical protein GOP47_0017556 [Adiantum capillus-veneris]|uniref:Uncharacterized protein n=1 Tax=Adiantum capillus-veneris TaxID=13818 RepID=A0A9D4Z9A3_ADICA|nr:hypothetical protein GOP47_0017556 [Adiantum capillus-veneris]